MTNLFTADVGQGKLHAFDFNANVFYGKLPQKDLIDLNISNIKSGDILVVEDAHLRESHKYTKSQPFTFEDLCKLQENAISFGIKILLFPHKKTPTARKLAGYNPEYAKKNVLFMREYGISTDEADVRSIAHLLKRDKNALRTLKVFKPVRLKDYQEKNKHIFKYIQEANDDLNIARTLGYGFDPYYEYDDAVHQFIENHKLELSQRLVGDGIFDLDSNNEFDGEELMEMIGLKYNSNSKGKLKSIQSESRLYTLVASFLRPDGTLRLREFEPEHKYHGKALFPNWKFVKANYFGCKPYHMNQGVAASNYKQHMRPGVSTFEGKTISVGASDQEYFEFKNQRNLVDKKTHHIWNVLYEMIIVEGLR